MKLRNMVLSTVLCILMIASSFNASAEYVVPEFQGYMPADAYTKPYQADQFTTVYAPWLKNFHFMSKWEKENGLIGGEACQLIKQLQISPVNPDIVYLGTDTSGLYRSENGGKTWYNVSNNHNSHCTRGLLCDPFEENTVYAAFRGAGHFRSKDGGRTWERILGDGTQTKIWARTNMITADAAGNIYLAATSGIYRLNRQTDELEQIYKGKSGDTWLDIAVSPDGQHIYAGLTQKERSVSAEDGIYTSHDGGKTWVVKGSTDSVIFSPTSIELHPENPGEIYAAGNLADRATSKMTNRGLFVSTDSGETYEHRYSHLNGQQVAQFISGLRFGAKNSDGIHALYYCAQWTTYNMHESLDYGKTFKPIFTPSSKIDEHTARHYESGETATGYMYQAICPDPYIPGRVLFPASGLYERTPDGKINKVGGGFSGLAVTDVAMDSKGKMIFCAMDVRAFVPDSDVIYDGKGNYPTYRNIAKSSPHYVMSCFDPKDDNHVMYFVGSSNGTPEKFGICHSYDGGHIVEKDFAEGSLLTGSKRSNPMVLQYDNEDLNTVYCSQYVSHDNGKTWEPYIHEGKELRLTAISPTNPNKMVAVYGTTKDMEFYLSEDKGKTWNYLFNIKIDLDGSGYGYHLMFFDRGDDNKLWYTCNRRYWGYINLKDGTKHEQRGLLNYGYIYQLAQNPENPNHMLIGSWPGLDDRTKDFKFAESRDGGKTWKPVPGFWGSTFHCIEFIPNTTEVFVGTMAGLMIYDYAEFEKYTNSKITIMLKGKTVSYSEMPVINNGRVLVPMRELFEQLGATVNYDDATRLITAGKEGTYVSLTPGSDKATINGAEVTLDAAPYITQKGRTMVPLRFVAEALNVGVGWDSRERTVYVK